MVARLAEHPNIAGMKESSGNVDRVGAILASVPGDFQVVTGAATTLYPSMVLGAKGGSWRSGIFCLSFASHCTLRPRRMIP